MVDKDRPEPRDQGREAPQAPEPERESGLSTDFFRKLVNQPRCLTHGECDNCGRCEH